MQRKSDLEIINKYFDTHDVSPEHRAKSTLAAPISADYMDAYLADLATETGIDNVAANRERLLEIALLIEHVKMMEQDTGIDNVAANRERLLEIALLIKQVKMMEQDQAPRLSRQPHAGLAGQSTATGSATFQTPSRTKVSQLREIFENPRGGKRARKSRKSRKVRKFRKVRKSHKLRKSRRHRARR